MLHFVVSSCPFTEYVLCALSSGSEVGLPIAADGKFAGVLAFLSPNMCVLHCIDVQLRDANFTFRMLKAETKTHISLKYFRQSFIKFSIS